MRTSDILATRAKCVLWAEKENLRKKSSCFTRLSRTKNLLACLSCNSDDSPACAKAFSRPCEKKKGWDTAGFQETGLAVFFRFHIETLCRLHLIVLVDLIMFTHIKQRICNLTVTCFSPAALFTFTDPMFDVSFSCIMLCHPMRYRYVKCTQARRPSPCRATWRAAHARVADASKRAPLIDASGDDRSQCWSRSK
jgi:hypothetical protein